MALRGESNTPYILTKISELEERTPFKTDLYQSQNTIRYFDLGVERVTRYTYTDKVVTNVSYPKLAIYKIRNLPIGGATSRKDRNLSLYELPLLLAINRYKAIYPILLFENGKAIPWSKITVIRDYHDNFIAIDRDIHILADIQCIIFPHGIRYGEDDLINPESQGLYFDSNGSLCLNNLTDVAIRIEIPESTQHVIQKTKLEEGVNTINFWPRKYESIGVIGDSNKIFFKQTEDHQLLLADPEEMIPLEHKGLGVYRTGNTHQEGDVLLLTYDKHHNPNITHLDPLDDNVKEEFMQDFYSVVESTDGEIGDNPLSDVLEFKNDPDLSSEENTANHLIKILNFDYGCMKDLFINSSRVFTKEFTGKEMNEWKNENNKLIFSRIRSNDLIRNDYVIVFKNGHLYEYYYRIKYKNAKVELPIINVKDDDHFIFLYFTKAMNDVLDINITDRERPYELTKRFTKDMDLYCNEFIEPMVYEYALDKQGTSFKVEINKIEEVEPHNFTFDLKNNIYYNKDLKLVSKRQFRYYHSSKNQNISHVELGEEFRYAQDPNRYLVFINGVKLNRDNYALCFPGNTNPFKEVIIYFAAILDYEDSVDIFYLPEELFYKEAEDLSLSGDIKIENNHEIPYLSKELQLIFVNGALVSKDNITDINRTRLKVKNSTSIHNVVIIDTLDNVELIATLLSTVMTHSYVFSGYRYGKDLDIKKLIKIMVEYIDKEDRWSMYITTMFIRILDYMTKIFYGYYDKVDRIPFSDETSETEIEEAKEIWDSIELPDDMNELFGPEIIEDIKNMSVFDKIFGKSNIQDLEDMRDNFDELKGAIYDMLFEQYILPYNIHTNSEFVFDYDNTSIDMDPYEEGKLRQLTFTDASLYDKMYHYRMRKLTQEDFDKDIAAGDVPWKEGE